MKRNFKLVSATLILSGAFIFTSCDKNDTPTKSKTEITSADAEQSDDVNEEMTTSNEAIDMIPGGVGGTGMRMEGYRDSCNVTHRFDTTRRMVTFTYNGDNCRGTRTRTGIITAKIKSGLTWNSEGSEIELVFQNFKVTRKSDGKFMTFNGRHLVKNVSLKNPIVQTIHGTMRIKFNESTERTWKLARKRKLEYMNDQLIFTVSGDSSVAFFTEVGVNKEGKDFATKITSELVMKSCGATKEMKFTSGKIEHIVGPVVLGAEFGYISLTEKAKTECDATGALLTYTNSEKQEQASKYEAYKK